MTMNLSYLRDIYGHTHIVRFIFFLFLIHKNKAVVANALLCEDIVHFVVTHIQKIGS